MRLAESIAVGFALLCALSTAPVRADATDSKDARDAELERLYDAMGKLEQRIADMEKQNASVSASGAGAWAERVRISGSSSLAWIEGRDGGTFDHGTVNVYDLRLFVDAGLARDFRMGDAKVFRDAGFAFEWNLERVGMLANNL